mmetsp:Transcript_7141/g.11288  ORF Transcript_7141/g.11288 Transcript_7141/m.11288 type:complete len:80 (+) Transcript_7141:226-465(+)
MTTSSTMVAEKVKPHAFDAKMGFDQFRVIDNQILAKTIEVGAAIGTGAPSLMTNSAAADAAIRGGHPKKVSKKRVKVLR